MRQMIFKLRTAFACKIVYRYVHMRSNNSPIHLTVLGSSSNTIVIVAKRRRIIVVTSHFNKIRELGNRYSLGCSFAYFQVIVKPIED